MKILAVDTSCDESCAAVLDTDSWKLLGNVVHSHVDSMTEFGGVVPEIASREHLKALPLAVHEVLRKSELKIQDIDWFAVTHRPGLVGALLVGLSFVKGLAFSLSRPYSVLNHIEAHLFSPLLSTVEGDSVPPFPWLALVASGGHTELFLVNGPSDYRWLGGTLDDAAGEAFDKIGKLLKLPYPAGPKMDSWVAEMAKAEDRSAIHFPRAKTDGFHFSFSGLKTAVALHVKKIEGISERDRLVVAASAQEAIVDALVEKLERAKTEYGIERVVLAGGVACNSRLRAKLPDAHFPKPRFCTDNAAMVALLAGIYHKEKRLTASSWEATPSPYVDFES